MTSLAREIGLAILTEEGSPGLLRRLADPVWFQAFGCVLGFDWHSSGVTTTVCGARLAVASDPPIPGGWAARDGCGERPDHVSRLAAGHRPALGRLPRRRERGPLPVERRRSRAPSTIDGVPAGEVVWRFLAGYSLPAAA
jgi:hypothetical protein